MKHILYSILISAVIPGFSAPAMAQSASDPAVTLHAQTSPQDFRQRRAQINRSAARNNQFINSQHARLKCGKGETRHLVIAGAADNFSSSGNEPTIKSARVAANPAAGWNAGLSAGFDNAQADRKIFSHLVLPANVRSGRFMIGVKTLGNSLQSNDSINVGNLGVNHGDNVSQYLIDTGTWKNRYNGSGFAQNLTNFSANFSAMAMRNGSNLQNYYRSSGDTILDVYVQDDHSVDYVAASVCAGGDISQGDSKKKGMTWGLRDPQPEPVNGVVHLGCNDKFGNKCEPYKGDTLCKTKLPILCINPMRLQKPQNLTESRWDKWSGGIVGTTNPMAAPDKLSVANAACKAEFGNGWRVAQHHDAAAGRSGWMFSAYGNVGTKGKRFWTDIDDQPNGVCWNRSQ